MNGNLKTLEFIYIYILWIPSSTNHYLQFLLIFCRSPIQKSRNSKTLEIQTVTCLRAVDLRFHKFTVQRMNHYGIRLTD
jgi:hypothetical protein